MSVIPCAKNAELQRKIHEYAEALKVEGFRIGDHGLSEDEFYNSGIFRGAIEEIRGQYSASMLKKREFVQHVLNHMEDNGHIQGWEPAGGANRHDYSVRLPNGRVAVIELKGCLDGNNTIIFDRPPSAQEFVIWSLCTNTGADPRKNAWSGIHTRLSAEIIDKSVRVDGIIIWDMFCGTIGRPCPKVEGLEGALTDVGPFQLPPACIYVMPATVPSVRDNPFAVAQSLGDVQLLQAFHNCFGGTDEQVNYVDFDVGYRGTDTVRTTRIRRGGVTQRQSKATPIRRS